MALYVLVHDWFERSYFPGWDALVRRGQAVDGERQVRHHYFCAISRADCLPAFLLAMFAPTPRLLGL